MSKTKNEERLEIVNKRLAEINDKDVFPKKEKIEETIIHEAPVNSTSPNNSSKKIKTYLIRISIVVIAFFVLKFIMDSDIIDAKSSIKKDKENVEVEVEINVPAKEKILKYSFSFNQDEHIIIFGKYQTEEETLKEKEIFSNKFVEFPVNHFYLPDNSNSTEKVYQLYLGPIKGKANAKQWSKLIEVENILLSY